MVKFDLVSASVRSACNGKRSKSTWGKNMQKIANLAAIMRSQISAFNTEVRKSRTSTKKKIDSNNVENKDTDDIANLIALKIHSIPSDTPQRREKVFRIFLESAIAAELGFTLMSDPKFLTMIEDIQLQMYQDEELKPLIDDCIDQLLMSR